MTPTELEKSTDKMLSGSAKFTAGAAGDNVNNFLYTYHTQRYLIIVQFCQYVSYLIDNSTF